MIENRKLKQRILEISYKNNLSHIGSCLTAVDIIKEIYDTKKDNEPFVLSSGHAGLALYTVIESKYGINAEKIFAHHGVHPDLCTDCLLHCSTGSLGIGLPISVGMALANRSKNVYCLISDGECAEGSIQEALRIAHEQRLDNLKIYLNFNGFGAYKPIEHLYLNPLVHDMITPYITTVKDFPFLKGLQGHYKVMNEAEYKEALRILS